MLSSILLSCVLMPRRFRFFFSIRPLDSRLQSSQAHNRFPISAFLFSQENCYNPIGTRKSNFRRQNKEDSMTYKTKRYLLYHDRYRDGTGSAYNQICRFYRRLQRQLKRHFQPGSRHESRGRNRTFKGIKCGFKPRHVLISSPRAGRNRAGAVIFTTESNFEEIPS